MAGVWVGFDQPQTIASGGYAGELAVPIWGAFMKRATRGDKPDWFERPANVVGLNVCRMSGRLPAGGCDSVSVVDRDGLVAKRSMVYTEYFVRGTEPTTSVRSTALRSPIAWPASSARRSACRCRPTQSACRRRDRQHVGQPGLDAAATSPSRSQEDKVEEPKKKRGFWGRIFGRGDEEKKKEGRRGAEEGRRKTAEAERCRRRPGD